MANEQRLMSPEEQEKWRTVFCTSHSSWLWLRRLSRILPSAPRCELGYEPFGGIGGKLYKLVGHVPSRKNPRFCAG
jgi:hypothetical protein